MVENITVYSENLLKQFVREALKKVAKIMITCSILLILCSILEFVWKDYTFATLLLILSGSTIIFLIFVYKKSLKHGTIMPKIKNIYEIYPEKIKITTFSKDLKVGEQELPLSVILKVVENDNCLFLYLNTSQAFLVDKSGFKSVEDMEVAKRYIENIKKNKAII